MIARRSFLTGLGALIAAPAVVQAASLMPVRTPIMMRGNPYLLLQQITREAVKLYIEDINERYDEAFKGFNVVGGMTLRVRLPDDYNIDWREHTLAQDLRALDDAKRMTSQPGWKYNKFRRTLEPVLPEISAPQAAALGAAAVLAKNPVMSRRFWGRE